MNIKKTLGMVALIAVMGALSAPAASAQCYGGGSGFSINVGGGYYGGGFYGGGGGFYGGNGFYGGYAPVYRPVYRRPVFRGRNFGRRSFGRRSFGRRGW